MTTTAPIEAASTKSRARGPVDRMADFVSRRLGGETLQRPLKAFPDHWSFWLGYIALFSLILVILSGILLTLWFKPSMSHSTYDAYVPLRGVPVSEAYASTLELSFEVRGGLLTRQVHYWASHVFIAAMSLHLLRVFFTGGFRKPRRPNWLIGLGLLVLGILGGYTGHSLPDDLLSGTGLRVIEGGIVAIPIIGTYLSSFIFGGQFPGEDIVSRLYVVHVFALPILLIALLVLHLILVWRHNHTQWTGEGRTNRNAVGSPLAVHLARAGGFAVIVFGFIILMAATLQINPVWLHGPYNPSQVSAGSRPDWYVAFLDGALRLMPPLEIDVLGYPVALSVLVPVVVLPGIILGALAVYPWIEDKLIGARGDQHVLDRPRNMPVRTGLGVAFIVFYVLLWIAGGNDQLATTFGVSMNAVTQVLQVGIIVLPPLAYWVAKRICLGLQLRDRDKVLHGRESGIIVATPEGGFNEVHIPLSRDDAYALTSHEPRMPLEPKPEVDENGIPAPRRRSRLGARMSRAYLAGAVPQPGVAELGAAEHEDESDHPSTAAASSDPDGTHP